MPYEFEQSIRLPADARVIYEAWMSSEGHTAMTGAIAHVEPEVNGAFDAWDGYISGITLELDAGRRIYQTWRTSHFGSEDEDSRIEVELKPDADMTLLTLKHSNVPDGQTRYEEVGWKDHYFEPMLRRFEWLRMIGQL